MFSSSVGHVELVPRLVWALAAASLATSILTVTLDRTAPTSVWQLNASGTAAEQHICSQSITPFTGPSENHAGGSAHLFSAVLPTGMAAPQAWSTTSRPCSEVKSMAAAGVPREHPRPPWR